MSAAPPFELVRADPGGLLLDLTSGTLFRLNESAALIWEAWLAGAPSEEIANRLRRSYGLPLAIAAAHVLAALKIDPADGMLGQPAGEFLYQRAGDGYVLSRAEKPLLSIDQTGRKIRLHEGARMSAQETAAALTAVAPKLIALRGHFVLHAAAVSVDGAAFVVAGDSGAGKTTTSRALVRAGASPLAEDKLVIRATRGRQETFLDCEINIQRWSLEAQAWLSEGATVSGPEVDQICTGAAIPIREIGFIDVGRRVGDLVSAVKLTKLDAAGALFRNSFCGSDMATEWAKNLRTATDIADTTEAFDLTMPDGVDELAVAARAVLAAKSLRSR
jgi:hypothetical protein